METMFDELWKAGDMEREKGNKQRAAALYRQAFIAIGLDIDAFFPSPEQQPASKLEHDISPRPQSAKRNARSFPNPAPGCKGGICGR